MKACHLTTYLNIGGQIVYFFLDAIPCGRDLYHLRFTLVSELYSGSIRRLESGEWHFEPDICGENEYDKEKSAVDLFLAIGFDKIV